MSKPNILIRLLSWVWHGLDGLRKVLHLILLLVLFLGFVGIMSGDAPVLPSQAVLEIKPAGFLVEELEGDPFDRAIGELVGDAPAQTVVQDIVDALDYASTDDRIKGVHLDLGSLGGGGLPMLERIADAIRAFRESGKPVIASADFMSQGGYYIAAHADEVYLHPEGMILLRGFGSFRTYFNDLIDKLKIDWNIFRVGTYKSFVEPYTRMTMSDEAREDVSRLSNQLWDFYRADIVNARGLDDGDIDRYANGLLDLLDAADGDLATAALSQGVVDGLRNHAEIRARLLEIAGADPDYPDAPRKTDMSTYLAQMHLLKGKGLQDRNVAIIVASGEITFGAGVPGMIGAESMSELLRRARADEDVAAVVLRIDSPGGSAFASDVIGNEIAAIQAAGKPVVASLGSSAASGGYWIATGADRIIASPSTVTGSIGIFAMFPTFQRSLDYLGVNVDGVGTTIWSGELRPDREMSAEAKQLLQTFADDGYNDFLTRVAETRGMQKSDVDAIGQGRVWTGKDALERGLVDGLGDIDDAVAAAAELAGIGDSEYGRKHIRPELTPGEQLIVDLLSAAQKVGVDPGALVKRPPGPVERLAERLETAIGPLLRFDDPKGVYAHCLCGFE